MAMASTKLVCIKQKSPTLPTSTQRGTQGFDKAGGFFMPPKWQSLKSRAEPPADNAALYKAVAFQISTLLCFFERPGGFRWHYFTTYPAFCQCLSAGSLPPSGCNGSALQCPAAESAQRTAVRLSYGLPSQAVRF